MTDTRRLQCPACREAGGDQAKAHPDAPRCRTCGWVRLEGPTCEHCGTVAAWGDRP